MKVLEISQSSAAAYAGCLLAAIEFQKNRKRNAENFPESRSKLETETETETETEVVRLIVASDSDDHLYESEGGELFLHHNKTTIWPAKPRRSTASTLAIDEFDVLIEDVGRQGLGSLGFSYRSLRNSHPDLVIISLSAFGLKGAYRNWQGNDFLAQAAGGVMHTSGYDGEAPLALPGEAAFMIAGLHGATAALTATLCAIDTSGDTSGDTSAGRAKLDGESVAGNTGVSNKGVHIDISAQDTFMQHWIRHVAEYAYRGVVARRAPRKPEGLHYNHTAMASDGWLYLLALREPWQDLAAFLGLEQFLFDDAFEGKEPPWAVMESAFHEAVASKSRYQWFAEAAELGWTFAPVEDPFAIASSGQVAARGGMLSVSNDNLAAAEIQMPPLPWLCDD